MGVGGFHCCTKNNLRSTVYFDNEDNPHEPETSRINKLKISKIVYPTEVKRDVFESGPQKIISNEKYGDGEFDKYYAQLEQSSVKDSCKS